MRQILDSGSRREFDTGAVRDIQEGKGRCDLIPLDAMTGVCAAFNSDGYEIIDNISKFMKCQEPEYLCSAIKVFCDQHGWTLGTVIREVALHYEQGCLKYGERNWEKGIPLHCYIDSAVRHYSKYLDGWEDEPHDRAFVWNLLGAVWTLINKPELNDLPENK